jgi:hypothetical protein
MFTITHNGTGFQITFTNGWMVSVQFSKFHYCERKRDILNSTPEDFVKDGKSIWGGGGETWESENAEVAVISPVGQMLPTNDAVGDTVAGYQTPEQVLETMIWVASQPSPIRLDATKQITSEGNE